MRLDLELLGEMHPLLPPSRAADIAHCAAVGLERHGHLPGAPMAMQLDETNYVATLGWTVSRRDVGLQLDRKRVTEDAAEAITLALVYVAFGWVVKRRLQQGEFADWLLVDPGMKLVALEVSGIDAGDSGRRLREKMIQAARARIDWRQVACVIELAAPCATAAGCSAKQ